MITAILVGQGEVALLDFAAKCYLTTSHWVDYPHGVLASTRRFVYRRFGGCRIDITFGVDLGHDVVDLFLGLHYHFPGFFTNLVCTANR